LKKKRSKGFRKGRRVLESGVMERKEKEGRTQRVSIETQKADLQHQSLHSERNGVKKKKKKMECCDER